MALNQGGLVVKTITALGLILFGIPSLASAAGNHPMAGCGLGYIAFGNQKNSKVYQILSATVNDAVSPRTSA